MKRHQFALASSLALSAGLTVGSAFAYADGTPSADSTPDSSSVDLLNKVQNSQVFTFDYGVPTSPALTLAGLSSDKTATSTPAKPFVISSPTTTNGSTGTAYAVDASPAWILGGNDTESSYETDPFLPILYRTRVNGVLYQGIAGSGTPSKSKPSELAFGLSTSLLKSNDPILATAPAYPSGTVFDGCLAKQGNLDLSSAFTADQKLASNNDAAAQSTLAQLESIKGTGVTSANRSQALGLIHNANVLMGPAGVNLVDYKTYTPTAAENGEPDAQVLADVEKADASLSSAKATIFAKYSAALNDAYQKVAAPIIKSCVTAANNAALEGAALNLGLGGIWTGTPGKYTDFSNPAASTWLAFRLPFAAVFNTKSTDETTLSSYWAVGGSVQYTFHGNVSTGSTTTPMIQADSLNAWGGLEYFSDWIKLEAEAGYTDVSAVESTQSSFSKNGFRWLATTDIKVPYISSSAVWLGVAYGSAQSTNASLQGQELLVTLNFGPPSAKDLFGIGS